MTFSIIARCPKTLALGVATASASIAVGNRVPHVKAGVGAIATQAKTNIKYGIEGLKLLEMGFSPKKTLETLLEKDSEREERQVIIIDIDGRIAAFTGKKAAEWKGHIIGRNYAVAGNMLVGEKVIEAMAKAFEKSKGETLAEGLLRALEAGQRAGGDKRGKTSAALKVCDNEGLRINLRVDLNPNPIEELRKMMSKAYKT